jgi:hypothetical protein
MIGLTQCGTQTPFSLRQRGTFRFICNSVFALYERKTELQKKMKYRCEGSPLSYRVSSVIEERRNIQNITKIYCLQLR